MLKLSCPVYNLGQPCHINFEMNQLPSTKAPMLLRTNDTQYINDRFKYFIAFAHRKLKFDCLERQNRKQS